MLHIVFYCHVWILLLCDNMYNIPFSLKQVVTSVADTLSVLANEKNLQLTVSIDEDVPDTIAGDPYRLSQILLNLCGNSIKFTDKGNISVS